MRIRSLLISSYIYNYIYFLSVLKFENGYRIIMAAYYVIGGLVGSTAAVVAAPLVVGAIGFGTGGIVAGSIGSSMMSTLAPTIAGGVVATLQSVGAAGMGVAGSSVVAGAGGVLGGIVGGYAGQSWSIGWGSWENKMDIVIRILN